MLCQSYCIRVGQKADFPCTLCTLKLSVTEVSCMCSCETIHHLSHLQMAAILLTLMHQGPGSLRQSASRRATGILVCFKILEDHWLKLLPPRGTIHQGCSRAIRYLKATLSSNEKQGSTSNSWQNLDKKGIFYSQLSRKGRRSEILGTGGTCCHLDFEPWTQCLFNEETWSEEQVTSQLCHFTREAEISLLFYFFTSIF